MLASIQPAANTPPHKQDPVVSLASKEFMTALKDKLSNVNDDPISYLHSQAMLEVLKNGLLKITDPTVGETVIGWDPSSKETFQGRDDRQGRMERVSQGSSEAGRQWCADEIKGWHVHRRQDRRSCRIREDKRTVLLHDLAE